MFRDPLYRQIRQGLTQLKDGATFEACANDLLNKIYPTLVPREGGDDAGLDGLIAKQDGTSVQLICTTGEDVLGNLTGSIESNLKKAGKHHACILATSQRLTNSRKRVLENRGQYLGRPLIQIYDQAGMAQLLYRDARWLKELLGLNCDPPPLSMFPITSRPLFDVPPIGRGEDVTKIVEAANDFVLIGQPGSGKTHLLFSAAKKGRGRFVVDEDIGRVAEGVRGVQPRFLIIDDAHSRLEFLKRLKHFRQQVGADFKIVASCWPGQEDAIRAALNTTNCHNLEELPQKQIKEVIQSQKIFSPDRLVAEIIHQSQGKPGLAVTLCRLCWETGSSRDVVLGNALRRDVKLSFEPFLGNRATHLLACFSIGGSAGMTLESAARLLGDNVFEIKRMTEQLAAAGVLEVLDGNRISVHPARLRQALVRDVVLNPPAIDLTIYLAETPDFAAATRVLIEAKLMGANLPDELLRGRLEKLGTTYEEKAFEEYAQLGQNETDWLLDNFPEKRKAIANIGLDINPTKTLRLLLELSANAFDERSAQGWSIRAEYVFPEIKRWILSADPNTNEASERRELLAAALEKWIGKNKGKTIAFMLASVVLSLRYEKTSWPPGEPMTVTMHFGIVKQDQLSKIAALWPRVLPIFSQANPSQGSEVANLFHEWVHPNCPGQGAPPEYENESRAHARKMMIELLKEFSGRWTFHYHLYNYALKLGLEQYLQVDSIAQVLYPPRDVLDWEGAQKRQEAAANAMADQLMGSEPALAADILVKYEQEALAANISSYPPWNRHVCSRIAKTSKGLTAWVTALFQLGATGFLLEPFLEELAADDFLKAEYWISRALDISRLQAMGIHLTIRYSTFDMSIWKKAAPLFKNATGLIEGCVLRNEIAIVNLRELLNHEDDPVAVVVATGLWGVRDETRIPEELFADWKKVMVQRVDQGEEHVLEKIFPRHPDIAYEWIAWRLKKTADETEPFWFGGRYDRALPAAVNVLSREQRRDLVDQLPRASAVSELVRSLIGRDLDLFMHLLSREELGPVRLEPLRLDFGTGLHTENKVYDFDDRWEKMALAAMEKGYSEAEIFSATQPHGFGWSGSMSSMYAARLAPFEKLSQHSELRLQKVGKIGIENFSQLRDAHLAHEKRAAVRGELA